jgi:hypothetical protein
MMRGKIGPRQVEFLALMQKPGAQVWRKGSAYICVVNSKGAKAKRDTLTARLAGDSLRGLVGRRLVKLSSDGIVRKA